jgi:hypothetical protein
VARRNPAFRIAIWGLSFAVLLSLVGALSLVGPGLLPLAQNEPAPVAQVATTGELDGLLVSTGRREVPDPVEAPHQMARESGLHDHGLKDIPEPSQPDPQALLREQLEQELLELRSRVNEISRTQLEAQLTEIHHAEQLLTQHQTSREIASLEREIESLKLQIGNRDTAPVAEVPVAAPVDVAASALEPPLRVSPSVDNPDRVDVEARDVPLTELLTALGQQMGWNLVTGPEISGKVTYHWRGVEPESALRQLLKAHGWQLRIDGEFALVEPLGETELPPLHVQGQPTRTAALPDEHREERVPDELWQPAEKALRRETESGENPGLESPVEVELPAIEEPQSFTPAISDPDSPEARPAPVPPADDEEVETPEAAAMPPAPRILPALPSTMTSQIRPRYVSSQQLLPHIRPLLTQNAGEVTSSPADSSHADVLLVKDQPQVIARVEELVRELDVPARMVSIDATVLQLRVPQAEQAGVFRQALTAIDRGRCPECGLIHAAEESISVGHTCGGWTELGAGLSCGVSAMSVEQVVARLKRQGPATITALAPKPVVNRQSALFDLKELQGFRRQVSIQSGATEGTEPLQGGLQLILKPIVLADDSIQLELAPSGSTETAKIDLAPDQCVVLGGLYFEHQMQITPASNQTGAAKDMHEVVVLIRAKALPR